MSGYLKASFLSWVLARSSLVESINFILNSSSKWIHTAGTLWCTGWSHWRMAIMFLTHKLTFSPLISVRANATCRIGDSKPRMPWLSRRYPRNSVRNASALVWSLSKIRERDPIALILWTGRMGMWSWRSAPLCSSSGGSSSGLSSSGGPLPPLSPPCHTCF